MALSTCSDIQRLPYSSVTASATAAGGVRIHEFVELTPPPSTQVPGGRSDAAGVSTGESRGTNRAAFAISRAQPGYCTAGESVVFIISVAAAQLRFHSTSVGIDEMWHTVSIHVPACAVTCGRHVGNTHVATEHPYTCSYMVAPLTLLRALRSKKTPLSGS